jgi:Na+-transporting NADH:ubiquinone oxidoreductase subunit NqrC
MTILGTVLSIVSAIIGASIGVLLTNISTKRRSLQEENKELLKENILLRNHIDVIEYLKTEIKRNIFTIRLSDRNDLPIIDAVD